jgi:hypothetical protein
VVTHFAKAQKFKCPGYISVLKLTSRKEKNDQGTFHVMEVAHARATPKPEQESALYWYNLVNTKKVQVDETPEKMSEGGKLSTNSQF